MTPNQTKTLDAVVAATEETGVCPTTREITRRAGIKRQRVAEALAWLKDKRLVSRQKYRDAPWRPLRTADGRRFVIEARIES